VKSTKKETASLSVRDRYLREQPEESGEVEVSLALASVSDHSTNSPKNRVKSTLVKVVEMTRAARFPGGPPCANAWMR
jgi:hypothetical protein